ncbi:Peptidyl-prolyl cis-trans isomerase FKBP65 [Vitis vinifera]|uniref:peptidylprolyl isomerase n=1 Tax=Vitis vinifera TaxID=29760 RepID=A0A438KMJ8_VITVI|nr:Peptidyl-prolyl cis-trans isomerase FKBP65 [Vitis vinifera]
MVVVDGASNVSQLGEVDDLDEEPGEVIESAPPLCVGQERELNNSGLKKRLLHKGIGWETPDFGDEVTVHYVGTLLDGGTFDSTRDRNEPSTFTLGRGEVVDGLDQGIVTMTQEEIALFTVPPHLGYGEAGRQGVPPNSVVQFQVQLISWITVVDVCRDGGIIKKILEKGNRNVQPGDLDELLVKYKVKLVDDTIVAQTPEEGIEFYMKDGQFCPAMPKAIKTMKSGEKVKLIVQPQCMLPSILIINMLYHSFRSYASLILLVIWRFLLQWLGKEQSACIVMIIADGFGDVGRDAENEFPLIPPSSVLIIDLELVSFKPVIDVTGDSKVFKKILVEGANTIAANEGATVTVRYTAKLEDGTIFEKKGFDGENPLQFITDEDQAVATMTKGERSIVTIHPEYGYGSIEVKQDISIVPPSSIIIYEVEMLDFVKEKAPWEMSDQEKIETAGRKKEEGNLLFKSGKYQRARKKYDKAADYVNECGIFGDGDHKVVKTLQVSCWLNGAACCLKLNNFRGAIKLCSKVLDIEFHNVKALYRRAQAYMKTADLDLAQLDIKKALEADPQNREVKLMQKNLKQLQGESNKRDAKLYSNMFAPMRNDTAVATKKLKVEKAEDKKGDAEVVATEMEKIAVSSDSGMAVDSC